MNESEPITKPMSKGWAAWFEKHKNRFWFLRGATFALMLMTLVPEFVNLSRFDFLRAFHALILSWNGVAELIGLCFGWLPFVPDIPYWLINTFTIMLIIVFPALIQAPGASAFHYAFEITFLRNRNGEEVIVNALNTKAENEVMQFKFYKLIEFFMLFLLVSEVFSPNHSTFYFRNVKSFGAFSHIVYISTFFFLGLGILSLFLLFLTKTPSFKNGLLFVIGIVAIMELSYMIGLPIVGDWITAWTNSVLGPLPVGEVYE